MKGYKKVHKYQLPKCVTERIDWVWELISDEPLTPLGAIELIFCKDEEYLKEEFYFGSASDWLEVTDDFKEWRDGDMRMTKEYMILHAFVNGYEVAE